MKTPRGDQYGRWRFGATGRRRQALHDALALGPQPGRDGSVLEREGRPFGCVHVGLHPPLLAGTANATPYITLDLRTYLHKSEILHLPLLTFALGSGLV